MPPATLRRDLPQEDIDRVNGLRRQMWNRGAQAFGVGGLLGGYGSWSLMQLQRVHPSHFVSRALPKLSGKHVVMWTMLDAVLLSYVAVTYEGKRGAAAVRGEYEKKQREASQDRGAFKETRPEEVRPDRLRARQPIPASGARRAKPSRQ